jgi:Tol biopolymer transport system component
VAFAGREPGAPWKIHVVTADGRELRRVVEGDRNEADPSWSPDGRSLMFGRPPDYLAEPGTTKAIHVVELHTGRVSTLPGSEGLFSPRWSPDGKHVVAMPLDQRLVPHSVHNPMWSADGRSIYFQEKQEEWQPVYRVRLDDLRVEKIVSAADLARACYLKTLGPDDSPVMLCITGGADLYALDWRSS